MRQGIFLKRLKLKINRLFTRPNWYLLVELTRANFKAGDHNSFLGIFWSFLGPVALLVVMYSVFRIRFGDGVKAYPLYLLIGIVFISFFITTTTYTIKIFFINRDAILNSTVPREILILSNFFIHVYKFVIELGFCWLISIAYSIFTWKSFLLLFPLLIAYIAFVLGVGLIILLVYCFARDIEHIWMIASRLLLFTTPIFYSLDSISPWTRKLIYWCNPLTPFLISFQEVFMGKGRMTMLTYAHSLLLGGVFFILGYSAFMLLENMAVERA